jgi:hypothetical protein
MLADAVETRTLHIYTHAARENVPDLPPDSFTTAYGRGIYQKIVGCLAFGSLSTEDAASVMP